MALTKLNLIVEIQCCQRRICLSNFSEIKTDSNNQKKMEGRPVFRSFVSEWIIEPSVDTLSLRPLSLLLTFQVNCPGCFQALSLAHRIAQHFQNDSFQLWTLSTAFEDWELNTLHNTTALVRQGLMVGQAKATIGPFFDWPKGLPVAWDTLVPPDVTTLDRRVKEEYAALIGANPQLRAIPVDIVLNSIAKQMLERKYEAKTFVENRMQGTPTWILYRTEDNVILEQWTGHRDERTMVEMIHSYIKQSTV